MKPLWSSREKAQKKQKWPESRVEREETEGKVANQVLDNNLCFLCSLLFFVLIFAYFVPFRGQ
jgi:hypothetical protein